MCRTCGGEVEVDEYAQAMKKGPASGKKEFTPGTLRLPRGGVVVTTAKGVSVQFGIPPETIKDCFVQNVPVPQIFCMPKELFDRVHGVNVAEAEFPAYFNFFVLQKRVTFLGTAEQEVRLRKVFRETLLGPVESDVLVDGEYDPKIPHEERPDLVKECAALRTFHNIDELFQFIHFERDPASLTEDVRRAAHEAANSHREAHPTPENVNAITTQLGVLSSWALNRVAPKTGQDFVAISVPDHENVVVVDCGDIFVVLEDGVVQGVAPACVRLIDHRYQTNVIHSSPSRPPFRPPRFGVTILGSGHGFDPSHRTSGFVLWLNRRGIVVDPPLNSRQILHAHGVPSRLVDTVIVTHCHADHDQGTFQKLLEENQCTLITTSTILGSFVRKYSALTGLSEASLRRLFVFRPVVFGQDVRIGGAEFRFFYSIHTIPCIGFEVYFAGKSLYFSGDTCYNLELLQKFEADGAMRPGRARFWRNFEYHHNLVLHEAGVPPIHTPVSILREFPDDVKKRLYLIHTSQSSIPEGSGLRIAPEGVDNTIIISDEGHEHGDAIELLKLLSTIDLFRQEPSFSLSQAADLLSDAVVRRYQAGETIFGVGSDAAEFFVVASGVVNILSGSEPAVGSSPVDDKYLDVNFSKFLVAGDYFGEMALLSGGGRTARAIAKTAVTCVTFAKDDFLAVLRGSQKRLEFVRVLAERRAESSWDVISANSVFSRLTNAQRTKVQSLLSRKEFVAGETIWDIGQPAEFGLLIAEGSVRYEAREDLKPFGRGSYIGDSRGLRDNTELSERLTCVASGWGYKIDRRGYLELITNYPGLALCLHDTLFLDAISDRSIGQIAAAQAFAESEGSDWGI